MLVLTRRIGESILLGDDIEITILDSHSGEIKIGISAPRSVVILRREIYDAVREENRSAAMKGGAPGAAIGEAGRRLLQGRK